MGGGQPLRDTPKCARKVSIGDDSGAVCRMALAVSWERRAAGDSADTMARIP